MATKKTDETENYIKDVPKTGLPPGIKKAPRTNGRPRKAKPEEPEKKKRGRPPKVKAEEPKAEKAKSNQKKLIRPKNELIKKNIVDKELKLKKSKQPVELSRLAGRGYVKALEPNYKGVAESKLNTRGKPRKRNSRHLDKFAPEFIESARLMMKFGATHTEVADELGICEKTLYNWMQRFPDFAEALKIGRDSSTDRVEESLYRLAIGFERQVEQLVYVNGMPKIVLVNEYFKPSTTAASYFLKNRRPKEWKDKQSVDLTSSDGSMTPLAFDPSLLSTEALKELKAIADAKKAT
jgi:hypothetical protein